MAITAQSMVYPAQMDGRLLFKAYGLTKSYESSKVLSNVSFDVPNNSVVSFVGENGAGKSTLLNIISGIVNPDSGHMELRGAPYSPSDYHQATQDGVTRVFQEQALILNVPVYENLLVSEMETFSRAGIVDRSGMIAAAQRIISAAGLDLDVCRQTGRYDFSTRQSIEIARACIVPLHFGKAPNPLVLLDEPTSALDRRDEEAFFRLVSKVKEHGSLLFVSHRLTEVLSISDLIYVLKDGELVATTDPARANEKMLHGLMVGREREADYYYERRLRSVSGADVLLRADGLGLSAVYDSVDIELRAGEVVGVGGLLDSGKTALGKGISGVEHPTRGSVTLAGMKAGRPATNELIRNGLGYVPQERLVEGLIPSFSAAWNLTLASGGDIFSNRLGIWRRRREFETTVQYIKSLEIRSATPRGPCSRLSGGNQQKVVIARWLCRNPRVLVLDNPTRGVDAGAKAEIYRVIRDLTDRGVGILLITDDLLELIGLSNRILIMQRGRIVAELDAPYGAKPSERELVARMLPQSSEGSGRTEIQGSHSAGANAGAKKDAILS